MSRQPQALTKTRVVRTADHTTRPAADAQCLPKRSERVTSTHDGIIDPDFYPLPDFAKVNRVWGWQRRPQTDAAGATVLAYHEAGHAVIAEAFGWNGVSAWQDGERGECVTAPADPQASPPAFSPAQAALLAVYPHAGLVAEQIFSGRAWAGPIGVFESVDFAQAEALLAPHFGLKNSGAHYYAQRYAANILAARWGRAREIAAHLEKHGTWQSDK